MARILIALWIVAAVQVCSAYQVKVPVFRQPYGVGDPTRIVNGLNATRGQFPHQAGVTVDGQHFCGGALIAKNWVLTAAHCIDDFKTWDVALGAHNLRDSNEPGRVTVQSTKAIKHQWYTPLEIWHDIGVISLPQDVPFSNYINIVKLPPRSLQPESLAGKTARVSGWGRVSDDSDDLSQTLQFIDLNIITRNECSKTYGTIPDYQFCCSGADKKSTCNGDSGGALTLGSGTEMVHLGIVSYGSAYGCAEGYPVGFTSVPYYLDWIANNTGVSL